MLTSRKKLLFSGVCTAALLCICPKISPARDNLTSAQNSARQESEAKNYLQPPPIPERFLEDKDSKETISETKHTEDKNLKTSGNSISDTEATHNSSRLESFYSGRAGEDLKQFGYDFLHGTQNNDASNTPLGAVQEDFILNIGDSLAVTFTGQRSETHEARIDSQGLLLLPDFKPIAAAGLSIGQLRQRLENAAESLHNTQIFVSLTSVKQVGVLLIGQVEKPGRYNLTAFNSIPEALAAAGGIKKTGSLRAVKLIRSGQTEIIDLYDLLIRGAPAVDIKLRDGDRIIIPPIGQTIAVAGEVKQPGIFELPPHYEKSGESYGIRELLSYAGGALTRGENRLIKLGLTRDGREITEELSLNAPSSFKDGDLLIIARAEEKRESMIELIGNTRRAGLHDAKKYTTLSRLINSESVLGDETYPLIGIIERKDKQQLSSDYLIFSVRSVLNKKSDERLFSEDKIRLFSIPHIKTIFDDNKNDTKENENGLLLAGITPEIIQVLKENAVSINGGVRLPGAYPLTPDTPLDSLLAAAGGLSRTADPSNIEITSRNTSSGLSGERQSYNLSQLDPAGVLLSPGDSVRVNISSRETEEKSVLISGEVSSPGRYDLMPGDKLSDLLNRAGGLTQDSYPIGAVFSRESERRAEESRFRAAAKDLENSLASAMQKDDKPPDAAQIEMVRELARELSSVQALGRITVEADPDRLHANPELDMLLEEGDRLYIPKRPLTVRVSGEILSPAALQFRKDKEPEDYISEAGGFTYHADKGRSFVVFPDGSAQPLKDSFWNHNPVLIPPGSSIIVPRDPKPFDFIQSARDFTQILSNLAVTSIFIDDLRD